MFFYSSLCGEREELVAARREVGSTRRRDDRAMERPDDKDASRRRFRVDIVELHHIREASSSQKGFL